MKTIIIDGIDYEIDSYLARGNLILKPLPKQPEAEKNPYLIRIHRPGLDPILNKEYYWFEQQAQLAADAVKETLKYIQGEVKYTDEIWYACCRALDAITNEEKGEN